MLTSLLTEAQLELLREEKQALGEIRLQLAELDLPRPTLDTLQQAILQLDELFLIVVVGEFNAGKSALMNALFGQAVLPEGVTPTTFRVTLVKWGEQLTEKVVDENFAVVTHPLPLLREVNIVDTPGTNAVIRHHERLTEEFVPRSDLVLFVTSADHPMTESERQFMERIRAWGKKVIIVLNKVDILEDPTALDQVRGFVLKYAQQALDVTPEFFPVSARLAQRAQAQPTSTQSEEWRTASGIDALANYIDAILKDQTQLELKFANPLGVADHIIDQAQSTTAQQAEALNDDKETVNALEALVAGYEKDLQAELAPRLAEVDNILRRLQERGLDFFDTTLRLTNIKTLARGDQVRAQFEKQVLGSVPQQIEEQVHRLIDWLVEKDLRQWQQIMAFLQQRQANYPDQLVGEAIRPLDTRRRALIDSVGRTAETIVESYDRESEARELAMSVESTVAQVALIEAGAVGLGALVLTALASSAADVTGLLAAGTLAIVGFFVIPYKRQQAKTRFKEKTQLLREKLINSLTTQFNHEAENVITRMKDGVLPYTRFVRAERERIEKQANQLIELRRRVSQLRAQAVRISGASPQSTPIALQHPN
ncbi:MAG TPA: dynamin family protein [Anaerolineae bacterium]